MQFRLAIFDMAGTTVCDPGLVAAALAAALAADGCAITPEAARPLMGYAKPEAIQRLLLAHDQPADAARIAQIHADFVARMLRCYRESAEVAPMRDAETTFAALRARGLRVALNTAFSRDIAETIVARFGWRARGAIDDLIAADEVPAGRPAPHMIQALMQRAGIADAREVVKIGDTPVDVAEGRNAGVGRVVSVTTGANTRAELEPHAPDRIIDALAELPAALGLL